jgi:hypothetical protein
MEVVPFLRALWSRRLLIAAGALVAIVMAIAVGRPAPSSSAVARTRVALDTPASQLLQAAPAGADTLPWRASLLAHLMATESVNRQLAQSLRVRQDQVAVVDSALVAPQVQASLPRSAADAAAVTVAPYVLTVSLDDPRIPVVTVAAAAPDRGGAKRLAAAAVAVLKSEASPGGVFKSPIETGGGTGHKLQAFVVEDAAPVTVKRVVAPAVPTKALATLVFVFFLWCAAGVFLAPRVLAGPRRPWARTG